MPTYEYRCKACDHEFEVVQPFTDDALTECPECEGPLKKVFGNVGITFKGSGFYKTDSRSAGTFGSARDADRSDTAARTSTTSSASSTTSSGAATTSDYVDNGLVLFSTHVRCTVHYAPIEENKSRFFGHVCQLGNIVFEVNLEFDKIQLKVHSVLRPKAIKVFESSSMSHDSRNLRHHHDMKAGLGEVL